MLYVEHCALKRQYRASLEAYRAVLDEWEQIFARTQPHGQSTDAVRVQTSPTNDALDRYLAEKERRNIDSRIKEARAIAENRKALLDNALEALTRSAEPMDRVYLLRFCRGFSVERIAQEVHYSESHVYRMLRWIRRNTRETAEDSRRPLEDDKKCHKNDAII